MRALFICAGFATRMYPLTKNFPKPLLKVAEKPVLDYFMEHVVAFPELEEIDIVTNALFFEHFSEWKNEWQAKLDERGVSMEIYNDGTTSNDNRLGAVADLQFVLGKKDELTPTLIAAGDNIFRFSLAPLWQKFVETQKNYILSLPETDSEKLQRTGVLEIGENDRVLKLHEKPENPPSQWTCPALYCLQPEALEHIPEYLEQPNAEDAPGFFISHLVERKPVFAHKVEGQRFDIGSMASYEEANQILTEEPAVLP